jgi:hypothetical protein
VLKEVSIVDQSTRRENRICGYTLIQQWYCEFSRRQGLGGYKSSELIS